MQYSTGHWPFININMYIQWLSFWIKLSEYLPNSKLIMGLTDYIIYCLNKKSLYSEYKLFGYAEDMLFLLQLYCKPLEWLGTDHHCILVWEKHTNT